MSRVLPLNALRVFDVTARCGSFRAAADELNLSLGSVSRYISQLEVIIGAPLFIRHSRGVQLTARGRKYFDDIAPAFTLLRAATDRQLPVRQESGKVMLWAPQTLGSTWISANTASLAAVLTGVELEILISSDFPDVRGGRVDFAIGPDYLGTLAAQNLSSEALYRECLTPVCSPSLIRQGRGAALVACELLSHLPIININSMATGWNHWLSKTGLRLPPRGQRLIFENSLGAYEAARNGVGITLGERVCVRSFLQNGDLVAPFSDMTVSGDLVAIYWRRSPSNDSMAGKLISLLKRRFAEHVGEPLDPFGSAWPRTDPVV